MTNDCCAPEDTAAAAAPRVVTAPPAATAACATCGQTGTPVETITVQALLALPLTEMRGDAYRFCARPECPAVYYSTGSTDGPGDAAGQPGQQAFREVDLRERVHQKHLADDGVFVCYCFRHTLGSIRTELQATGRSTVVQRVTAGIKTERCACEVRNPQGSCCLGNVRAAVKRLEATPATATVTATLAGASRPLP